MTLHLLFCDPRLSASDENAPADGEIRSADGKLLKDWRVRERRFVEEMTPDTLRQTLTAAIAIPDLQSASVYQPMRQVRQSICITNNARWYCETDSFQYSDPVSAQILIFDSLS